LLPFISFYFPESGLFKGLRAKEIKKSPAPRLALKLCSVTMSNSRDLSSPGRGPSASIPMMGISIAHASDFVKQMFDSYSDAYWFVDARVGSSRHAPGL
jgi:hypothetical protein